jgi:hypothetical protein
MLFFSESTGASATKFGMDVNDNFCVHYIPPHRIPLKNSNLEGAPHICCSFYQLRDIRGPNSSILIG